MIKQKYSFTGLLVMGLLILGVCPLVAQPITNMLDSGIRYGQLDNGFTYYILHNEEPKNRASFYIIHNVGAILEEDDQDGLAHMLEHMAFNGSVHFPGKGIKNFLEKNGVEFGSNINAYTDLDETVYNISNVPTQDSNVMDSCVWILHDWSGSISLEGDEIDAERAVIKEEWRTRNSASSRMYKTLAPIRYYQSKYAVRDVIGSMDVVENSDHSAIERFYHKWYRPDLQAAVIVGDFDVEAMEQRVKTILSTIPKPVNPATRKEYTVGDNEGMLFGLATDKEATSTQFTYSFKHDVTPRTEKDSSYLTSQMDATLIAVMIATRLREILQKPDAPFINAQSAYYNGLRTVDYFTIMGVAKENALPEAIEAILTEVERARKYGFVKSELARAKVQLLKSYEYQYKMRDELSNDQLALQIKDNYLIGEPAPGISYIFQLANNYLPTVTPDDLKPYLSAWMTKDNAVFTITGPEKESVTYPTKREVEQIIAHVKRADIESYKDEDADVQLMKEMPVPGKIMTSAIWQDHPNTYEITLDNGVHVVLFPTDYAKSQVLFSAVSAGGMSKLDVSSIPSATYFGSFMNKYGLGDHSDMQLSKMLVDKNVSLNIGLGNYSEYLTGSSDKEDLETLLQLIYMIFEQPRFDEEIYQSNHQRISTYLEETAHDPDKIYQDSLITALYNGNPRVPLTNSALFEKVSFKEIQDIYYDRFAGADDFTFLFVGDFDLDSIKPLIAQYIGGIPKEGVKEKWEDTGVRMPAHDVNRHFTYPLEMPKCRNQVIIHAQHYDYNVQNNLIVTLTASILRNRYFESMREEAGGTYGANVQASTKNIPYEDMSIYINFDSDPDKTDQLLAIAYDEIEKLLENGVDSESFLKAKESLIKTREQSLEDNNYILQQLSNYYFVGIDNLDSANFEAVLADLDVKKYNKKLKQLLGRKAKLLHYEIVMEPAEESTYESNE